MFIRKFKDFRNSNECVKMTTENRAAKYVELSMTYVFAFNVWFDNL